MLSDHRDPSYPPRMRKKPLWKVLRTLVAGSRDQEFLNRRWIEFVLRSAPSRSRRWIALRILALSPHYFLDQWSTRYAGLNRSEILEAEFARNRDSRAQIFDMLLRPVLSPTDVVLDFGCGPGFLALHAAGYVRRAVAADVSRGTIACARVINRKDNLEYVVNGSSDLAAIASGSIDFVYSFAVFQHIRRDQAAAYLAEFFRALRPGGAGLCHFALGEPTAAPRQSMLDRYRLRMDHFPQTEIESMLGAIGFRDVEVLPVASVAHIEDDVGIQHLARFRRPL